MENEKDLELKHQIQQMGGFMGDPRDKPVFAEGEKVSFDFGSLGSGQGTGIIRGKISEHIVDFWIVEVLESNIDKNYYPWSCISVMHTCLRRI
jgi:hypothetical protein